MTIATYIFGHVLFTAGCVFLSFAAMKYGSYREYLRASRDDDASEEFLRMVHFCLKLSKENLDGVLTKNILPGLLLITSAILVLSIFL